MRADCVMATGIGKLNLNIDQISSDCCLIPFLSFTLNSVKVQAFPRDGMVAVEKWDFGDIDHLSYDALRPLSDTYLNVHQMVFCASLHGKQQFHMQKQFNFKVLIFIKTIIFFADLQPCRNAWDKDDCARFHELTIGKTFKVEIKHIRCGADGNYVAELVLIGPKNINISDVLVREHRAI